ncbi:hypothetical protein DYB32_004097 [Aphanomyces invadans]|uniref:DNA replication licensing factor MCM3 n=1 Tax=Aphanomyces invadans TaxID=157072 RepID=A0A418AYI4_9STRA|nr:hypothetical protein DYB32_004097 [Aphanomyces invadans]
MDAVSSANDEVFRRHKNYFAQYIESDESNLPDKIRSLAETEGGAKRLMIDLNVLRVYDVVKSVHYCKETNSMMSREYRDHTSLTGAPTTSVYPTKDENGNLLETEFGLCQYKDYQAASSSGVFKTVLLANNIQVLGKEVHGIVMTTEDVMHVREFAKRSDAMEILSRSMAPSIFGHSAIKQALLLQLLGGVEKNLENGTHLRGDINVLMVGDPSTAKSQLLRFVRNLAPLAVSTTGRGSSGVGLTAAVTLDPDTKEKRLEAGAMVLADRGIVCIDEFDKMGEADRVAIHEVMEQQTVTIAKAGIHATLNARCSVLAAANPVYGQYQKNKRPQENIGLPDSLLSRFDLLFVVLDSLDRHADRMISDHVLRNHRYVVAGEEGRPISFNTTEIWADKETTTTEATSIFQPYDPLLHPNSNKESVLTVPFLKKFIHYAKTRLPPVLTEPARDLISEGYAALRSQQTQRTLPVTARTLETLIRLASAHAKARLSKYIELADATQALNLMKYALYHEVSSEGGVSSVPVVEEEPVDEEEAAVEEAVDMPQPPPAKRTKVSQDVEPVESNGKMNLRERVTAYLSQITSDESEESMGQQIHVKDLLAAVNKGLRGAKKANKQQLGVVLMALEEENKLMYLRDGDDPYIVLV